MTTFINREKRISKVAYFSSMLDVRQIVFDLAAMRPDLFVFNFIVSSNVYPWNPESTEPPRNREEMHQYVKKLTEDMKKKNLNLSDVASTFPPGYVSHIAGLLSMGHAVYNPGNYKYLLVMDGGFDNKGPYALSGRLASFLASGAVVLLQVHRHITNMFYSIMSRSNIGILAGERVSLSFLCKAETLGTLRSSELLWRRHCAESGVAS